MSGDSESTNHKSPSLKNRVPEVVIRSAQIGQLYSQVRTGMLAAIVAAFALAALLWQVVPRERILVWAVVFLAVQIPRHVLLRRFHNIQPHGAEAIPWGNWFLLGSGVTALLFGMSAVVIFPNDSFVHQCVLACFLAGFAASTAVAHAPLMECYVSSVLLTLLPLLGRFLYQGGESGMVLAFVGLAFAAALLGTGNSFHKMIATSIRLRFQRDEMLRNLELAHEMLENRVSERTAELAGKNDELLKEIMERNRAEEALGVEKTRFQALAENLPLGLVSISGEGSFLYANRKFRELFDYDLNDVPDGRHWFRMAYPDPEYRHHVISCWLDDLAKAELGVQRSREFTVTCKDGSEKTVLFRPVQLTSGEHLLTCEDVTERKRTEAAVEEHVSMMEAILEKAADGICVCHDIPQAPYVRFSHWNPRMSEITGYIMEEINQSGWYQLMYPDPGIRQAAMERMLRMRVGDDMRAEEWMVTTKSGVERQLSISTSVINKEDGRAHVLAIMQDVTERKMAEDRLRESQQQYRMLAQNISDVIWAMDMNLNLTYVSPSVERMHGWGAEEWLSFHPGEYLTPHSLELVSKMLAEELALQESPAADPNRVRTLELEQYRKDGTTFWTEVSARFLYDERQSPVGIIGATRDISERKRSEEELKQEREFTDAVIRSVPGLLYLYDETGRMVRWNKQHEEFTGYSAEEMRGMHVLDWFGKHEPDTSHIGQRVQDVMTKGRGEAEANLITKDGRAVPFYFTGVKLTIAGKPYFTGIGIDITERKRAEEELKKSRAMISYILDSVPQSIFWKDRNSVYLGCNEVFARAVGLQSPNDIVGKTDYDLPWPRKEADAYRADDREVMTLNQAKRHIVEPLQQSDGARLWIDTTKIPLTEETGSVYGVLGVYEDITERKKTEDAIKSIVEGVSGEIGEKFFESSVTHFAKILNADFTLIGEISYRDEGAMVRTVAFSSGGELQDNYEYDLKGAPCEEVTKRGICSYPRGVAGLFPQDHALERKNIEAYVGVCLYNSRGIPIGIMAAMYLQPLENVEFAEAVLRIFASRAAAEIERNRAEEALRDSEATLRTLLQAAPIGIGQVTADRTLGWTNQLLCTMVEYSREELAGQSARILYDSDEEFLRVGREKHPDVIRNGTGSVETRFQRKDGSVFDVLLSSSSVFPGDLSHGMVFTAMDITERKRSEQQLKRLGAAVESAGETIVVTDSEGSIIYVNPTFEEITGYSRQEALGKNPRILKSGKHDRTFYRDMWDTLLDGQVWRGRFTNRRKDGTLYEETATISPIKDKSGRIVNYVAVKRDVTGEAMLQKQLLHAQKMEAIGTLAGGMAHDFNNLLQAILGYSDLLLMKKEPGDPDRKRLEVIQHAARDGADLVSRILTFSRKVESRTRPIDLNEEIRKAQELLRRTVPRMIEIKLVLAENLQIIDADPAQVEQVLLNLAINAQHAMPDGGQLLIATSNVSLSDDYLRTHLRTRPGHYVLLTVSDTGEGMEPDVLDRIFEPFFTTKTNGEGTGLGLSMVHGIVSQHGGYIRCYSEPGSGTSFKIYFPVSAGELISDLALTREMPAFGTETVLLVDDDDRIREMGRQMIEMGGYKVIVARSAEEALEIFGGQRKDISLIILDLIMPGIGGARCLEELLRIDPDVRVLVASGYPSNALAHDQMGKGARGFVSKPYDAKDILAAIRKVLDRGEL
jgi:two-component system, cell cycle sensor histidine kinase and response regulator CckA